MCFYFGVLSTSRFLSRFDRSKLTVAWCDTWNFHDLCIYMYMQRRNGKDVLGGTCIKISMVEWLKFLLLFVLIHFVHLWTLEISLYSDGSVGDSIWTIALNMIRQMRKRQWNENAYWNETSFSITRVVVQ